MIFPWLILAATLAVSDEPDETVVVVTATRSEAALRDQAGNTGLVSGADIEHLAAVHPSEVFSRVPGAWITRGSSQEHLAAIRSPILTGPGACGAFLYLEDGLPVRPAGFCNINQLIELNTELARRVEVIRGPGSALFGSNALHGMVNVITPSPAGATSHLMLDTGPDAFVRLRGSTLAGASTRIGGLLSRDDGWRDGSGHDQAKVLMRHEGERVAASVAATWLQQDTAGFIVGEDSYRDPVLARANPSPGAFRHMDSQRASLGWHHDLGHWSLRWRPYIRRSRMEFLQHFIPGQPLERNGHHSAGVQWLAERTVQGSGRVIIGTDLEYADISVLQVQDQPLAGPIPALNETRPAGRHYDFTVVATTAAAFLHLEAPIAASWRITSGLRAETTRYRYDNLMSAGNLRDDGTACGFGGCLYNRPANRSDRFTVLTPKLGLVYRPGANAAFHATAVRGHRAPQVNELYRLQRGQDVAELRPERMDALELGMRGTTGGLRYDLVAYSMHKRNVVFQDSGGLSVSDGRTRHHGLEATLVHGVGRHFEVALSGSIARHRYDFDRTIAGGETIRRGAEVPAAPRHMASARLNWHPASGHRLELEVVRTGAHWLDASNVHRYHGHTLLHLRGMHELGGDWHFGWRLTNLSDRRYAERADFAFGNYRYFPGAGRSLWLSIGTR
jgi:iron complex outermembrane recepter protein